MKKRKWLSLLLAVMMLVSAVPFFPVTADAADGTVEVSTWAELKKALDYTTNCSVVKVVKDIETKSLNGHTGLHQDNIIFMTMAMDKVLDLNGHTVNAYAKYYSEVAQGYLINISHKDARLTIRDSVGGGALIGEFNQEFYYEFINVSEGTLVMESGTVKMLCPSKDNQYTKCAIGVSGTAIFNGGEVLTQVTSPGGEREERYLSRRLQAIRGEAGGSVTINGGTFDRVVLHSTPTPENRGKYELVVNGGFFRQSIAQVLVGDVYASHLDHLTMQINDAYFMRTTDKLDQCRLVLSGKLQSFYDRDWDYRLLYNDIPGATFHDALSMMDDLIPHLISENGAVFTDVHDGNWYVRGNMRQWVENGGPIMIFQGTSFGVQGGIARVISNAYGVKEVLLDGEPMACGERGFSAPQVDTTAESEHQVSFVMYPISPMLRVLGYSYSNDYSTGYIRMLVDDETGYGMDIVVLTTDTLDGKTPRDYADDIYDYGNFGYGESKDGALLLISIEDNDWYISTCGYGITAFTDAGIEYIGKQIKGDLSDGNFAGAFDKFADLCDDFITQARTGEPYDVKNLPKEPLSLIWIPIAIVVGFVLSLIIVGNMKAKLKTVRFQAAASNYIKDNSLNINERRDLFLYNTVTRTAKPKNDDSGGGSSTHTSSSGATHGGGGGKF